MSLLYLFKWSHLGMCETIHSEQPLRWLDLTHSACGWVVAGRKPPVLLLHMIMVMPCSLSNRGAAWIALNISNKSVNEENVYTIVCLTGLI